MATGWNFMNFCNKTLKQSTYTYYKRIKKYIKMTAHEIDYRIYGEEMQYVEIELDPEEGVIAEAGQFYDDGRWGENGNHFW